MRKLYEHNRNEVTRKCAGFYEELYNSSFSCNIVIITIGRTCNIFGENKKNKKHNILVHLEGIVADGGR
jgi:hypothetical protein